MLTALALLAVSLTGADPELRVGAASVAITSVRPINCELLLFAGTRPGQRTMKGIRCPPSQLSRLTPRHGRAPSCE